MINFYGVDCTGWEILHPELTIDALGYLPSFIRDDDPRPAAEQIDDRYVWGGWRPFEGFSAVAVKGGRAIQYPGDPILEPIAERRLRDEVIAMYPSSWVAVFQPSGEFSIARID